jgi:hypothetical protein
LFSHTNTIGSFHSAARLMPSWKSPIDTAPSPKKTTLTRFSPRYFEANAVPAAIGMCPPTIPYPPSMWCSTSKKCIDPPSPFEQPVTFPNSSAMAARARSSRGPARGRDRGTS